MAMWYVAKTNCYTEQLSPNGPFGYLTYDMLQVPNLFCIGDANGKLMLAHAASAQGISSTSEVFDTCTCVVAPMSACCYSCVMCNSMKMQSLSKSLGGTTF